jgi:Mg-chelatase subunit ChlD
VTRLPRLSAFSLSALFAACLAVSPAFAQDLGGLASKVNLDLPLGVDTSTLEDDENPPEVVSFYGQNLEGDGFFYAVDHSGSMNDSGELATAKREIIGNITQFSERTQFGVVFFDLGIKKYPSSGRPVEATAGGKSAALSFINGIGRGGGSCMMQGIRAALEIANLGTARRKVLVYVGDGGGTCSISGAGEDAYLKEMVATVTAANYQRLPINTIGVMMGSTRTTQENYMKQLSAANGGSYRRVN